MKKLLLLVAFSASMFFANAQSGYKKAIGLRLTTHATYDVIAASYKHFLVDKHALEFNLGYGGRKVNVPGVNNKKKLAPAVSLSASYQFHGEIETGTDNLFNWFAGGGFTMFDISSKNKNYAGFGFVVFGATGLDYKFKNYPINVTVDWRPTIHITSPEYFIPIQVGTIGIAGRYTF